MAVHILPIAAAHHTKSDNHIGTLRLSDGSNLAVPPHWFPLDMEGGEIGKREVRGHIISHRPLVSIDICDRFYGISNAHAIRDLYLHIVNIKRF